MSLRFLGLALALLPLATIAQVKTVTLDQQTDGKTIPVRKGAPIVLRLPAQLGTGYRWMIVNTPAVLTLTDEPKVDAAKPESDQSVGSAEMQRFQFVAARVGSGVLKLAYKRSWQRHAAPQRTFSVTVAVSE